VNRYTVTITPEDGRGAQTVVSLEVSGPTPRITELNLKAGKDAGVSAAQLPPIDQAVTSGWTSRSWRMICMETSNAGSAK
jgi:hypothetical protein